MLNLTTTPPTATAAIPSPAALIRAMTGPGELRDVARLLRADLPGSPSELLGRAGCRVLIAAHPECPPDVLEVLERDPDLQVRLTATRALRRAPAALSAATVGGSYIEAAGEFSSAARVRSHIHASPKIPADKEGRGRPRHPRRPKVALRDSSSAKCPALSAPSLDWADLLG